MLTSRRRFIDYTLRSAAGAIGLTSILGAGSFPMPRLTFGGSRSKKGEHSTTVLFFDDWPLDRRDHVDRHVGHPELQPEATFVDPRLNVTWGYPSVFRDSDRGVWRCLYQGWDFDRKRLFPLVAESNDGMTWHTPDLSKTISLPDRAHPHQVLPVAEFSEWNPCYYDERAASSERLKGMVFWQTGTNNPQSFLWVSPDGLHWRRVENVHWQRDTPDPVTAAFWNECRSTYVLTTRPSLNDRRIAVSETKDWHTFSDPELSFEADALDSPLAQTYGMPVFPYEGWFIGLLWMFHVSPDVKGESPLKFLGGKVDCQLAYSRNGWHFQRGLRDPFIANSDPSQFGAGCIQPSCLVLDDKETVRIYGSAAIHEHGYLLPGDGALVLHTLRLDGFTYLQSSGGAGLIGTRPLLWRGGRLELNVLAPAGEVRVQITDSKGAVLPGWSFDECVRFAGDDLHWEPRWTNDKTLQILPERALRIEVHLDNARLYAIRGNFKVLTAAQTNIYDQSRYQEKN
jgi:hypothetical protein